jgi:uncharacterized membrane protein YccF (DUF307 family)
VAPSDHPPAHPAIVESSAAPEPSAVVATPSKGRNFLVRVRPIWIRAIYFVLIGWWLALLWMILSYVISLTVIGIPVGIMMLNRLPAVFTLQRN